MINVVLKLFVHLSPVMPRFTEQVEAAVEALSANPAQQLDENEFIDASRLVYDGIRDIRKAVLMIRVSIFCQSRGNCQNCCSNEIWYGYLN